MRRVFMLSLVFVTLVPMPARSQNAPSPAYRVISANRFSTLQSELAQAAAEGYRVRASMRPAPAVRAIVVERSTDKRDYFVSEAVERDLRDGRVPPGFVILPHTLGAIGGGPCGAVFERSSGEVPTYRIESAVNPGNLQRDILAAVGQGDRVRMMGAAAGFCALFERAAANPPAGADAGGKEKKIDLSAADYTRPYLLIATNRTATLESELAAAAARGFRLHSAAAADEFVYLLERQDTGTPPRDYVVVSASRSETVEREINQAAAKGYHLHPFSMLGMVRGLSATFETTVVMEKGDQPPLEYRVLNTSRASSLEKELVSSAAQGWQLVATAPSGAFSAVMQRPAVR